jgi:di/tricarboxylate transporter
MFEFTLMGGVILLIGIGYLLTVGRWLTPARIPVDADLVEEFDLEDYLAQLRVRPESPVVGLTVDELEARTEADVTVLQIQRNGEAFMAVDTDQRLETGDVLIVHGSLQAVNRFREQQELGQITRQEITEETFAETSSSDSLAKAVVPENSPFVGETLAETRLQEFHRTTVLAIRREGELIRTNLTEFELAAGDLLLVQTTPDSMQYFTETTDLVMVDENAFDRLLDEGVEEFAPLSPKTPIAVAILGGVIGAAALDVLSIVVAALGGVFLMVVSGCLSSADAYDAVSWNIIFLLAGVIPLGLALEATGGAALIAEGLVATANFLPLLAVLFLFYIVTGLLANVLAGCHDCADDSRCGGCSRTIGCQRLCIPAGSDVRFSDVVYDTSGLPDKSHGLRSRWLRVY